MKLSSRRYVGVAGVAATATLAATFLALAPAQAASPRLDVNTTSIRAAAGVCSVILVTPLDIVGEKSKATETVTILLSENPSDANEDLDFCVSTPGDPSYSADTPSEDPSYANGLNNTPGNTRTSTYKAGPGVTGGATSSGGTPDVAAKDAQSQPANPLDDTNYGQTNPSGVDRARYSYNGATQQPIRVGVVGLTAGSGTVKAFFDNGSASGHANNYTPDTDEVQAPTVDFNVSPGGPPGSLAGRDAVTSIVVDPAEDAAPANKQQLFTATLTNNVGDPVRGVRPSVQVASNGANPAANASCGDSNNAGVAQCSFTGTTPGTDTLTVYVNRANGTAGPDFGETRTVVTRTTSKPAVAPAEARYLDLTPESQTIVAGRPDTFTATITDVNGAPAQGVSVTFTESGPGTFSNNSSTISGFTDETGRVRVRVDTLAGETGTQTITAAISTISTQCSQPAGAGTGSTSTTPAGRCSDTATNTITATSPSPSPSTKSPTPSATPTATISPSRRALGLRTSTPDIQPNQTGILDATGEPNAAVELRCYTRPNTDYFTARSASLTSSGQVQFRILPGANTRCYVRYASDDSTASTSVVINVHTTLSLSAVRTATRTYVFQGRNLPRRAGQLITLYRVDNTGREIRTSNLTTDASGIYRVTRTFTGTGTFRFKVRTSQTLNNAAGVSNTIVVTVR